MGKAKIMLVAIAILGILGGAVAFKATEVYGVTIYTGPNSLDCTFPVVNFSTAAVCSKKTYATAVRGAACPLTCIITKQ